MLYGVTMEITPLPSCDRIEYESGVEPLLMETTRYAFFTRTRFGQDNNCEIPGTFQQLSAIHQKIFPIQTRSRLSLTIEARQGVIF